MALERLTADDRLVLWTDAAWPQDVGVLAVLKAGPLLDADGRFRLEAARGAVASRLHTMPRLRQVLRVPGRGRGWPLWVDDPSFDLTYHVREAPVPAPGDELELLRSVETLRQRRLDSSRPLWEMWFLPGLSEDRIGWFLRLHHVVADGIAAVATLTSLLDSTSLAPAVPGPPWTPQPEPRDRDLLVDNIRRRARSASGVLSSLARPHHSLSRVREAWPATRELLWGEPGPSTSLDGLVGPTRRLDVVRSNLSQVSSVAHANGATVNDVLLAMIAGGVGALLRARGERVEGLSIPVYVPMSLRRDQGAVGAGNRISQIIVRLPIGRGDPRGRLRQIAAAMAERKAVLRPPLGTTFHSKLLSKPMLRLVIRQRVNVASADLIGPSSPRYFAGARILDLLPMVNLMGNVTLGVGALSYAGRFDLLATADGRLYPDLDVFAAGATDELDALSGSLVVAGSTPA